MSKQRFASQVDVNKNLSKPVTQHYLPKKTESAFAKPDHVIASSSSRNSSKNMPRFSSNDMVHNHYLDEARKKTQERDRNSKTSVMLSARFQSTADGSKPKPRRNNQTSRSLPVSKSSRVTITAVPKADHSKSSSSFSDSKQFVLQCPKTVVLEGSTGKIFTPSTTKVDSERPAAIWFNMQISSAARREESAQTLDVSAGLKPQCQMTFEHISSSLKPQCQMTFEHISSSLKPQCQMTSVHNSSGLNPQCQMTFEHISSSLKPQCQMTSVHNSSGLSNLNVK
ncbi:hypothetical protein Tco_1345755 [Tanacetum coccineum]